MNDFENRLQKLAKDAGAREASAQQSAANTPSPIQSRVPSVPPTTNLPSHVLRYTTRDVFSMTTFRGNQLAIVELPVSDQTPSMTISQSIKQAIAREFNFSETVFLHGPRNDKDAMESRILDIFTIKEELPFAGHPVIGALCHLAQSVDPPLENIILTCKAGPIFGRYDPQHKVAEAEIPHSVRIHSQRVSARAVLKSQIYLSRTSIITSELPIVSLVKGMTYILICLPSVNPHLEKLDAGRLGVDMGSVLLDEGWTPSFIGAYFYAFTSHPNEKPTRIRARMLEQSNGEDPATGSAAGTLASFLALKDGKPARLYHYVIEQGVEMGRASEIHVKVRLDGTGQGITNVFLAGKAVLVTQGTLLLPE